MTLQYADFVSRIWSKYKPLADWKKVENSIFDNWSFEEFIKAGYINFITNRKSLYGLSIMLENYAVKNKAPLVASFEKESLYKYVEERYRNILKKIPKAWIIGSFNNPFLAQGLPKSAEVISCVGTELSNVWIVATKGPHGPFGLLAEEYAEKQFRGFFSISPIIYRHVLDEMSKILKIKIDFNHLEIKKGSY